MKTWSIKMRWYGGEVHVATGYATEEEALDRINAWRDKWRCADQPFFVVPEDDGDEEGQGVTASGPDSGVPSAADENPPNDSGPDGLGLVDDR